MPDWEGFITHFPHTKNNAAKTKHSFFVERRKKKQKTQQKEHKMFTGGLGIDIDKQNQKPPVLERLA